MAQVTPQEASRIISHMNADHAPSLSHYLERFAHAPARVAALAPRITEFSTDEMAIEYGPQGKRSTWHYTFDPPMYAGQARKRLEAMHSEARKQLGLSDVTIDDVRLPTLTLVITLVFTLMQIFVLLAPNTTVINFLPWLKPLVVRGLNALDCVPTADRVALGIKLALLGPLFGAHTLEIFFSLNPLLKRYNVESPTARALYTILTFFGGFPIWTALKARGEKLEHKLNEGKSH
ncbi:BZ3500_MvSof-1268-A1-R1_Chr3-1g05980 [Microbotryum saponariae]|uniref:BZ3500_MvSof-1268-A1-R1_Chr3-1g05980 protein n=1 Tax=Microbotryum saponariae TaxID=289078 RepID=A0A2X0LJ16_9BASI|nr:BZ3500_MvSof-1268-A1-R1_Chr3-1g05980 [Microbotryum saponariae]SDA05170.1 BZ3501_MvSof-1269-A2-R1_Chr3-1g05650 [Microbotryum saponariae]